MRFLIINAQVPGFQGLQQILIDKVILEIAPRIETTANVLDVAGDWVSLGGIDLQINGALGLAFPDLNTENCDRLEQICQFLWDQGVDGFLPTIVTTSIDNIARSLSVLADSKFPQILGVHLEGPFLSPEKRGAHPEEFLLPLTVETVKRVLGDYASIVKVMTLAPELDPSGNAIAYLKSLGITVSLGHSQATAAQAQQAFQQGASMVTHAFNAMPSLHHREPGLLGAAIANPNVYCGLIADGQHVSPIMIDILLRASQCDHGIFLVSDALSPLGLPDGRYPWDSREIKVINGTARLLDGTLAGTTRSLFSGVQNLVNWQICDLGTAIAIATTAPRTAIGLPLYLNQPAQLLRWRQNNAASMQRIHIDSQTNFM
ncbi:MAG: N-acetylglucosamine-6-phosphate deacetylase [Plectolyngbya sp. WJT66-NPBG17]|nr:N-acetylglucosamine-6-phosphate deacetylase [Plectolyngbya sp. WJT66-NPBG17]MBW4527879.1 N-acetylglucosamine-6-phosphate deacetylase [Phormidium tanganyikae FI6-MK23]